MDGKATQAASGSGLAPDADVFTADAGPFFRRIDWAAFWAAFLLALGVYVYTLAPTVTLEDSGELAVASDYLGVPHPPGYPIWSLLTWFFQWVFHLVTYHGHPNPAWSVGLCSAFFGALASGLLAMLVSRSGTEILRSMKRETELLGFTTENAICWVSGVTCALLFAFTPVLWSQAVIVEVYALNAFFLMIVVVLLYVWMERKHQDHLLYALAFLFGLGLTNHQSLMFLGLALVVAVMITDIKLFRDYVIVGIFFFIMLAVNGWAAKNGHPEWTWSYGPNWGAEWYKSGFWWWSLYAVVVPVAAMFVLPNGRRVGLSILLVELGGSFYLYMAFASEQNPPINWGYPRTWEGFMHALTRGQYEKISPVDNFKGMVKDPLHFLAQVNAIVTAPGGYNSVVAQFAWYISWLAALPFFFFKKISRQTRMWLVTSLIGFLSMTIIFIVFQNPQLDVQTLFIGRVQYIQAHAIYAMWIGYGLVFGLTFLDTLLGQRKALRNAILAAALLLSLVPILRNAYDQNFIKLVGGCEQNGHDFGWQFGNWQLRGAVGIKEDLQYLHDDEFEKEWAAYPNPAYPPEMGPNAIFFGGTDPGRFVPTYMIYCAKVRPDVFLITQNALADNTYMNVMRDLMGNDIWIPSQQDSNYAFKKYVEDIQAGRIPAGADVSFKDGRVSVQGVQGVMMINGILCKMIFEANKHKHDFYVEESYVIPWMYPYLSPHGLIMKINQEQLPSLTPEMIKDDTDFWNWYCRRLIGVVTNVPMDFTPEVPQGAPVEVLSMDPQAGTQRIRYGGNPKFQRDVVACKTFSKLRSAIAGLYAARRMFPEAEYAFQQAIDLYPLSPEANFRLADIFMQQRKFTEARVLMDAFIKQDPANDKVMGFLDQIKETEKNDVRRRELEASFGQGQGGDVNAALELADIYSKLSLTPQFEQLSRSILNQGNLPPQVILQVAQLYANARRADLLEEALLKYLERSGDNQPAVLLDLSAVQFALGKNEAAVQSMARAIQAGGEPVREQIRQDQRFEAVREMPEYRRLVPSAPANVVLPFTGM